MYFILALRLEKVRAIVKKRHISETDRVQVLDVFYGIKRDVVDCFREPTSAEKKLVEISYEHRHGVVR